MRPRAGVFRLLTLFMLLLTLPAGQASAQRADSRALLEKIDRLERDIMLLQRQVARGGAGGYYATSPQQDEPAPGAIDSAQSEVRLTALEDELRSLHGKLEENQFQIRQMSEKLQKFQEDADLRLRELEYAKTPVGDKLPVGNAGESAPPASSAGEGAPSATPAPGPTTAGDGVLRAPPPGAEGKEPVFTEPREHYNYAFRQLNQTHYDDAAKYFESFIAKYPNDPLIGNSHYWLGETYYIRRDYVNAATQFSRGFEALPEGPKAPDNLLKLAMSLSALKRDKEACTVLGRLLVKFKAESTAITQKAEQERSRIGCQ